MNVIEEWASAWGLPGMALADLRSRLAAQSRPNGTDQGGMSEAAVLSRWSLASAADPDLLTWRNNVGACEATNGRVIRYGLANDSKAMNEIVKSADKIGIKRHLVRPCDVGRHLGLFVSVEFKRQDWKMPAAPDPHTRAQLNWAATISAYGGIAHIYNGNNPLHIGI